MALVLKTSSSRVPIGPERALKDAIQDFQSILSNDQRTSLQKIKTVPDADAVITFTAQLDYSNRSRKGRSIASRLHSVLQSVREFSTIIDTFVSSHPDIAALVWGSIKLTMLLMNALWQSFDQEFKPDADDIQRCGDEVKEELALAKAQADHQDQVLQNKEREAASGHRSKLRTFMSVTKDEIDSIKQLHLQRHLRDSIGSGKTILTAGVIEHVFANKGNADECVTFFFVRYDDPPSLKAETILRSIVRQSLDPVKLSEEMVAALSELDRKLCPSVEDLVTLLRRRIALSNSFRVIIDGLDECEVPERRTLLEKLVNGIERIVAWCENLLQVDEERQTVQFAHGTIYDFITGECFNLAALSLAQRPWPDHDFNSSQSEILRWSYEARHYALIRLVDRCGGLSKLERSQIMMQSAAAGDVELISGLVGENSIYSIDALLQIACEGGHFEAVERLLAAGAKVDGKPVDYKLRTALQAASEGGHLEVVERLLAAGANINAEPAEYEGRTALQAASGNGHLKVVKRLLAAGANINAEPAYKGRTALQAASDGGHLEVVKQLLIAGANINAEPAEIEGRTALQAASDGGHLEVVKQLLIAGANINAEPATYRGRTALQAAFRSGRPEVVELLKRAGAV
ncbi:hypothetical protein DL770_001172 [Monosporascus sp. CRB-9-2]|nr:hypothetical protein DL770_001172 [Monosporascus sp. CRB-9-2]